MPVFVTFGEPLWRDAGMRETRVELSPEQKSPGMSVQELLSSLPGTVTLAGGPGEPGVIVIVNDQLVPPSQIESLRIHDGDHVIFQVMLSGG